MNIEPNSFFLLRLYAKYVLCLLAIIKANVSLGKMYQAKRCREMKNSKMKIEQKAMRWNTIVEIIFCILCVFSFIEIK